MEQPMGKNIGIIDDATDLKPLIEPYLPSVEDRAERERALELLKTTISKDANTTSIILASLGSYLMDTHTSVF